MTQIGFSKESQRDQFNLYSKENRQKYFLVDGCQIYNVDGVLVRNFIFEMCSFMDNGSLLSADIDNLYIYDNKMRLEHSIKDVNAHHQINRDSKGNFLILGSDFGVHQKKPIRFDKFIVISPKGVVLKSYSFKDHADFISQEPCSRIDEQIKSNDNKKQAKKYFKEAFEYSHFNSFYEIPPQKTPSSNPYFKEGNFVVNSSTCKKIYIFNSSLDKIVSSVDKNNGNIESEVFATRWMHDIQPTEDSKLIIYRNTCSKKDLKCSSIDIVSNDLKKTYFSFSRKKPINFYSPVCGGVQVLKDDSIIFSEVIDNLPYVTHVNRQGELIKAFPIQWTKYTLGIQRIQLLELNSFLKNNTGP